jgi:DinB superfamily
MSGSATVTLAAVAAEFRAVAEHATNIVSRVGIARLAERPAPKRWSIAECLMHLTLATEAYLPVWQEACGRARANGLTGHEPFQMDWWGKFWVWFLEPPPKVRFPAPQRFVPTEIPTADRVLPAFLASQEHVLSTIKLADGVAIDRVKIASAFDRRVRYSVWSSFCANASHQRRHLWQAERVADQIGGVTPPY